ncbi:MAG: hypothetical protein IPL49_11665 [Saprospirales bacterium]|nr:hypothetical protein [Saprospirales bacterium]MBK8491510.1 hypothetical protein [Saprospirales bacterium]
MKRIFLLSAIAMLTFMVQVQAQVEVPEEEKAQEPVTEQVHVNEQTHTSVRTSNQDKTLLGRNGRVGFFVSPYIEQGPLNEPWRTSLGGGVGLILGNAFLGVYGAAGADYEQVLNQDQLDRIDLAHGGLWLGFTPIQHWALHPYGTMKLGAGVVNIDTNGWNDYVDNVLVWSPELGVELNLTRFLRLAGTAGYRWVDGVSTPNLTDSDFSGWTGTLTLRLGYFGRDHRRDNR